MRRPGAAGAGWVVAIVALAVNMRVAVTSVPPVLGDLRHTLGLGLFGAALLTAAPVVCFGALAPAAAPLAARLGLRRALLVALAALVGGEAVRLAGDVVALFAGTLLAGGAVAVANALLPALVKDAFAERAGAVTGVYTTAMGVAASLAAALSAPLAGLAGMGWRASVGAWVVPGLVALAVWVAVGAREGWGAPARGPMPTGAPGARPSAARLLRDPVARRLAVYFGLQSVGFYAVVAWLPSILQARGMPAVTAGLYLSLGTVVGTPLGLVVPALAARLGDQRRPMVAASVCTAAGLVGLAVWAHALTVVWVVVTGLGLGVTFPLGLTLIALRTRDSADTTAVSTFAQTAGYLMAACGPLLAALAHTETGSWSASLFVLAAIALGQLAGLGAGRPGWALGVREVAPAPLASGGG